MSGNPSSNKHNKPSVPQGTRDFGPEVVRKRQYILNTIRGVFELYGFQPLETPAMENLETLMGKYGEEGDKLIFKILNNGLDRPEKHASARENFEKVLQGKNVKEITERALRYDLTIPFARYVAMNQGQLTFPFKRYQVQPVWRADRPQKGRYREFYQCDADVVGSQSLMNEADLSNIYHEAFTRLGIHNYELRINSRKILAALAELCGGSDKMMDITIAIDKLDKIGLDKVKEELEQKGLNASQISIIENYLLITGTNEEKLVRVKKLFEGSETGRKGIGEIEFVLKMVNGEESTVHSPQSTVENLTPNLKTPAATEDSPQVQGTSNLKPQTSNLFTSTINLSIDLTLARGLNYYTGIIFEAKAPAEVKIGSIGGGGRYDDLTGLFGVPGIPGVGISFGVDRIYDVMEELNLFPATVEEGTRVLFFNLGEEESRTAYAAAAAVRKKGVAAELYHEVSKLDKQFKYAEKKKIPFVAIIGSRELEEGVCTIKDLKNGHQSQILLANVAEFSFF
jgi:histidyl-tRNA synthetase